MKEKFNHFFVNMGQQIQEKIEHREELIIPKEINIAFFLKFTTTIVLNDIISQLPNKLSSVNDNINNFLLNLLAPFIPPILSDLINLSFEEGFFFQLNLHKQKCSHCKKMVQKLMKITIDSFSF